MPSLYKLTAFVLILLIVMSKAVATDERISSTENTSTDKQSLVSSIYDSLYSAIEMDSVDEIRQFIAFGADINHRYQEGKTPLMLASTMGSSNAIQVLLELGADVNLVSVDNMTALDYAYQADDEIIITSLQTGNRSAKAPPNVILIRKIQFLLGRLGYNAGDIDGNFGERTKLSLEAFAKDSKQIFAAEISTKQVEFLKEKFFNSDFKKKVPTAEEALVVDTPPAEANDIVETIPLEDGLEENMEIEQAAVFTKN